MPDPSQPRKPKSTEDILREMEAMSKGVGSEEVSSASPESDTAKGGGALKSLLGFFVKVVPEEELEPQSPKTPPPPRAPQAATRTGPRVSDLVQGERAPEFRAPVGQVGDLANRPFDQIYREAGITDPPCSVDELGRLLENPTVADQPLSVKVVAVNLTLSAKGIGADIPIADAVRRDRALDAFQQMLDRRAAEAEQRNASKIQQITKETEEYLKRRQAEIEALRAETADAKRQSVDFSLRRAEEEKRMANLISPFLEGAPNPVTIGNKPGEGPAGG